MKRLIFLVLLALLTVGRQAAAQNAFSLVQATDSSPAVTIGAEELAQLDDPLFRLALKNNAREGSLNKIVALLGGEAVAKPRIFVVHENISDDKKAEDGGGGGRRVIMGFDGIAPGGVELKGNVMFSFFFCRKCVE